MGWLSVASPFSFLQCPLGVSWHTVDLICYPASSIEGTTISL